VNRSIPTTLDPLSLQKIHHCCFRTATHLGGTSSPELIDYCPVSDTALPTDVVFRFCPVTARQTIARAALDHANVAKKAYGDAWLRSGSAFLMIQRPGDLRDCQDHARGGVSFYPNRPGPVIWQYPNLEGRARRLKPAINTIAVQALAVRVLTFRKNIITAKQTAILELA